MLSEEVIDKLAERLANRIEQGNEYILQKIGESVKKIRDLNPSKINEINKIIDFGGDYNKIAQKLADITNLNVKDIYEIFDEVAENNYQFAEKYYKYKNIGYIPYKENTTLQDSVSRLARMTANNYYNFTNSGVTGFYNYNPFDESISFLGVEDTYKQVMDTALLNVSQGKETFDNAMVDVLKQLGESGLRNAMYETGTTRRLDSVVRMNLKDGLNNLQNEMQDEIAKDIDADGVEITVHANPAPDHADVQGRQFTNEEFEKLQTMGESKDYKGHEVSMIRISKKGRASFRPISMYNCYHRYYSIVLGVDEPQYSEKELQKINEENEKKFEYDGVKYTKYQGIQLQRRIETEVRKQKDTQILAKASDNKELIMKTQEKISQLTAKYKELSDAGNLSTRMERMRVAGYKKINIENDISDVKNIESAPLNKWADKIKTNKITNDDYKGMLADYDKWYNSLDKKEVEKVLDDLSEHNQQANSLNINTLATKQSNPLGEFINKKLGYDGLPELIDEKEFWVDENGKSLMSDKDYHLLDENHWFRGISGKNSSKYINEFKTGKLFAGEGYDANGTFFSSSYVEADAYAKNDDDIIYAMPKKNAKIIGYEKLGNINYKINEQIDFNKYMNDDGELYINFTDKILNDKGYLASLLGFDIIDFKKYDARKLILNRKSIKVVK